MKTKLSKIIDYCALCFALWILFFAWIRFYTREVLFSLILGLSISILLMVIIHSITSKKEKKKNLTIEHRKEAERCFTNLKFNTIANVLNYLETILSDFVILKKEAECLVLSQKYAQNDCIVLFCIVLDKQNIDINDLAKYYAIATKHKASKLIICGENIEEKSKILASNIQNINVILYNQYDLYNNYIKEQTPPPCVIDFNKPKWKIKQILQYTCDSARAKTYFIMGIILLFSSFFVIFKIYYLISASILILFSACIKFYHSVSYLGKK